MNANPEDRTALMAKVLRVRIHSRDSEEKTDDDNDSQPPPAATNIEPNEEPSGRVHLRFYLIEVVVFILLFAYNLSVTVLQSQIIYQTCSSVFGYSDSDCSLLGKKNESSDIKDIEAIVQPYAARVLLTMTIIESLVPVVCGVFLGSWSDRIGRKPFLMASFAGYSLYYAISYLISILNETQKLSPWYYLLAVLPHAILGGRATYAVAANCYISDTTSVSQRPDRMTIYETILLMGLMVGSFASGYLYEATNASTVLLVSACSLVLAFVLILAFLPESLHWQRGDDPLIHTNEDDQKLFDFGVLRTMWKSCFKRRQYNDRSIIWLSFSALLISAFVTGGSSAVFYLFTRKQFSWSVRQFTTYETFSILLPILGNIFGLVIFRKFFNMSLVMLAILSFTSSSLSFFMRAFAYVDVQLYLAIVVGVWKGIANPMCKTIIFNIIPEDELGKVFSFYTALQGILPFAASFLYIFIYSLTMISFPGCFNLLSAILYILCVGLMLAIWRKTQLHWEYYKDIIHKQLRPADQRCLQLL